jgi:exosortase
MSRTNRWKPVDVAFLLGLPLLAIAATWTVWFEIFSIAAHSAEDSQIFLAIPIAGWLVWLRRGRLRACGPSWNFVGPGLIIFGAVMERAGAATATDIAEHMGVILVVLGAVLTIVGVRTMTAFLPAVLALGFLMPVPGRIRQPIALYLQEASAHLSQAALELVGIVIERSGNVLIVNGVDVAVAEACNGMRMVSALALISFAFVFSVPMRHPVRLFLLLMSPAVALLVNILRLIPTVLLYGYTNEGTADLFHEISGWAVLGLAVGILWGILSILRWLEIPIDPFPVMRRERAQ